MHALAIVAAVAAAWLYGAALLALALGALIQEADQLARDGEADGAGRAGEGAQIHDEVVADAA